MPAEVVQSQYDELKKVADRFGRQAEAQKQLQQRVARSMQSLQGGWQGKGSTAFFAEMNGKVLPVMKRLEQALAHARITTNELSTLVRAAEEEAAKPFRGGQRSQIATDGGTTVSGTGSGTPTSTRMNPGGTAAAVSASPVINPRSVFQESNMKEMIGKHFKGEDLKETNQLMEKLLTNPTGAELQKTLDRLADIRGVPREEFRAQYEKFLAVRAQAEKIGGSADAIDLKKHGDFLGSTASMRYGKVVGDVFGVDPVFGALLNPTGGMVGPGNSAYEPGDNSPIGYHGIFHDAAGYLHNYHDMGPGYDYMGREKRDTSDPLTGQRAGVQWWLKQTQLDAPGPDFLLENPVVPGVVGTVVDVGLDGLNAGKGVVKGVGDLFSGDFAGFGKNMDSAAKNIARIPGDAVVGLTNTAVDTVSAAGKAIAGGIKSIGKLF